MGRTSLFAVILLASLSPRSPAATPLVGQPVKVFNFAALRLVPDPTRGKIYAAVPATNSVAVINVASLTVTTTIAVGSSPVDLAISLDGSTLYVANSGSSAAALTVIDLKSLNVTANYSLPSAVSSITTGLDGRVYAVGTSNHDVVVFQLDGATGALQTTISRYFYWPVVRISPDGKTLFAAETGLSPSALYQYDVSTPTAALITSNSDSENGEFLAVSHGGKYVCLTAGGGNAGDYGTALFEGANVASYFGVFTQNDSTYPGPLAFGAADTFVYDFGYDGGDDANFTFLRVYNTQTFTQTQELPLSFGGTSSFAFGISDVVVDPTGSYVFVAQTATDYSDSTAFVTVFSTGSGPLVPAALLPEIKAPNEVDASLQTPFTYQIPALNSPTSYTAASLPAGLKLNPVTGVISGSATTSGYSVVPVTATNAAGTASATLRFEVENAAVINFTVPLRANATVGVPLTFQLTADQPVVKWSSDDLPAGFSLDPTTGVLSGTAATYGTLSFGLEAQTGSGLSALANMLILVRTPLLSGPAIGGSQVAGGELGQPFNYRIAAGSSATTYGVTSLPAGLQLNAATGLITGTPAVTGTFNITLFAGDAKGVGIRALTLYILSSDAPAVTVAATTPSAIAGQQDGVFTLTLSAPQSMDVTVNYKVQGSAVNGTDYLLLAGKKKIKAGVTSKTIKVIPQGNLAGAATKQVKLTVEPAASYLVGTSATARVTIAPGH